MVPDFLLLYAMVIVLFSLAYFFLASPPFLLVRLDLPDVSRLFRGLFNVYFWMLSGTAFVATVVFIAGGRLAITTEMLLIATAAALLRKKVLERIDQHQSDIQSGDASAMRRLRRLHLSVMGANVLLLGTVAGTVPYVLG